LRPEISICLLSETPVKSLPYSLSYNYQKPKPPCNRLSRCANSVFERPTFLDGNKRTGLLAGSASLYLAGYDSAALRDEIVEVSVMKAEHKITLKELPH
jgi:hypothetical protein